MPPSQEDEMLLQQFGKTMREVRRQRQITLQALKELTQLSVSYLGQIERGVRNPSLLTVLRIATALRISVTDLMTPLNPLILHQEVRH